jgi:hypothetical protein
VLPHLTEAALFQIVALPFDALQDLPPLEFKLMTAVLRYVNRAGECWPVLRQLAADIGKSEATVCRAMKRLAEDFDVFTERSRAGNGRYFYRIAERFLPRWPRRNEAKQRPLEPENPSCTAASPSCTITKDGLSQPARQEAKPVKQDHEANARAREGATESAPAPAPARDVTSLSATTGFNVSPIDPWRARVRQYQTNPGQWLTRWGPTPDQPGCPVPAEILATFGFAPATLLQTVS